MIYLVVGVDRRSLAPWHANVAAGDVGAAKQLACERAGQRGLELVVAAVVGPNSCVLPDPAPALTAVAPAA